MKRPVLYMMAGLPASGKSYLAEFIGAPIVSSDAIRKELYGDEDDQSHNHEVFNEVHNRIRHYLLKGESCVYDATNLSRKRRTSFLKQLPAEVEKVVVFAATELNVILEQNAARKRKVPEDVIMKMYKTLQLPRKDEGWDEIKYIVNPKNKKTIVEYLCNCYNVGHDNPHHSVDIFNHMLIASNEANKIAIEKGFNDREKRLAYLAALFHDIGKPIVKSRLLRNEKEDNKSHYYNHAEIGAYMISCCGNQFQNDLTMLFDMLILVQWHMMPLENKKYFDGVFEKTYGENMKKVFDAVH